MSELKFKPKFEKIVEVLLYISHKKQDVDIYHASKLVYLSDYFHFNRYRRPITFEIYTAMAHGPVATKTYELLKGEKKALADAKIDALPFEVRRLDKIIIIGDPYRAVNYTVFSKSDLLVMDDVIERFADLPFGQLHRITSKHFAYQNAWKHKPEDAKSALMSYDDILEENPIKKDFIEEYGPISSHM